MGDGLPRQSCLAFFCSKRVRTMFRVGLGSKAMGMAAESAMQGVGVRGYVNTVINIVNAREAWVVERLGKFHKVLEPGLSLLIPFVDVIRHKVSLKEVAVPVRDQRAITRDNVLLEVRLFV